VLILEGVKGRGSSRVHTNNNSSLGSKQLDYNLTAADS
jgi:hypothetical protein